MIFMIDAQSQSVLHTDTNIVHRAIEAKRKTHGKLTFLFSAATVQSNVRRYI